MTCSEEKTWRATRASVWVNQMLFGILLVLLPVLRSKHCLIHFRRFDGLSEVSDSSALLLLTGNSSEVRFPDVPTWSTAVSGLGEGKGGRGFRCRVPGIGTDGC
ncbi:hypothetical protein DFJ58DRAFT_31261 [Suillus subalutaceus]|uniref:uncharacterized protein n=1 Tax=Suillus subalutaceus TaxID=48586 RepID=UPI001B8749D8|nr:uncharacterized protein DFJ58DRAFT_31261 [Suillus subalutaceus]KAG1844207.1 hypothetical protein DFJ58DRAFT_31261 [Suillus subalutaceus]